MPPDVLSRREIATLVPPESPIEERMAELLDDGLGTGCRGAFLRAATVADARAAVEKHPRLARRHPLLVVPQPEVGPYRADFLVALTAPGADPETLAWADRAFLLECDGQEFHGDADRIAADVRREREIRRWTGLDVVRFSGAEISYAAGAVTQIMGTLVDLRFAVQAHPLLARSDRFQAIADRLSKLTSLPAKRAQHVGRNSVPGPDPYDPSDTRGIWFDEDGHRADASLDVLADAQVDRAVIAHVVANARAEWVRSGPALQDEEPDGGFVTFDYALVAAIEGVTERFFAR